MGSLSISAEAGRRRSSPGHLPRLLLAGWFLLFSLATRAFVFGDPSYQEDELLFFAIGQRMHDGLMLYVDLWDRKPPGLFAFYYLLAAFGSSVVVYQMAAALSVAATGWVVALVVRHYAGWLAGAGAGTLYAASILHFGGAGGQAAVFYNLAMAAAALSILHSLDDLKAGRVPGRTYIAMLLAGLAITFKQTAIFEGAFFGIFALWQLYRAGRPVDLLLRDFALLALTGALPMLASFAFYAVAGHFDALWHTLVGANLAKTYNATGDWWMRLRIFGVQLAPILLVAIAGLVVLGRRKDHFFPFVTGWVAAAVLGFLIIPNLIDHYVLPLIMALCVAAGAFFGRRLVGPYAALGIAVLYLTLVPVTDISRGARSAQEMRALVERIEAADPEARVQVFDGPVRLYALTGSYPPSPLFFPLHTNYAPERNVSQFDTRTEFARMLSARPTTMVFRRRDASELYNAETLAMARGYVDANCDGSFVHQLHDLRGSYTLDIYTGCAD